MLRYSYLNIAFPFLIYRTGRVRGVSEHEHDFWEISFIHEGRGVCVVDGKTVAFHSPQIFLTPPSVPHVFRSQDDTLHRQTSIAVYETILKRTSLPPAFFKKLFAQAGKHAGFSIVVPERHVVDIENRIDSIYREFMLRPPQYKLGILLDLARLLIGVDRIFSESHEEFLQLKNLPPVVRKALETIETSYADISGLKDIVHGIRIDWRYFIRLFKQHVGLTPIRYLNHVRIEKACDLLVDTRQIITHIAFDTGYKDCGYFTRRFKSILGLTPSEFRDRAPQDPSLRKAAGRYRRPH